MNFSKGDYLTFEQTHRGERSVTGRVVKAAAERKLKGIVPFQKKGGRA